MNTKPVYDVVVSRNKRYSEVIKLIETDEHGFSHISRDFKCRITGPGHEQEAQRICDALNKGAS